MTEDTGGYIHESIFSRSLKSLYAPVIRQFSNDTLTYVGVSIGKFLYPPFPIQNVIGIPMSLLDPVPNFVILFVAIVLFVSLLSAIVFGIRRLIENRRKKKVMTNVRLYFNERACVERSRIQRRSPSGRLLSNAISMESAASEGIYNRNPVVQEILRNREEPAITVERADQEQQRPVLRATIDKDPQMVPNNLVKRDIVPSEPCERHVVPGEPCERNVVTTEQCEIKVVTTEHYERAQQIKPERKVCQSPTRKPISQSPTRKPTSQSPTRKPISQSPTRKPECQTKKVTFELPNNQPRKPVLPQPNKTDPIARRTKVQGSISRK